MPKKASVTVREVGILKRVTAHTLRHSFATHFLESGGDLFTLQKLLGHTNIRTTIGYIHVQRSNLKKITSPLDLLGEVES